MCACWCFKFMYVLNRKAKKRICTCLILLVFLLVCVFFHFIPSYHFNIYYSQEMCACLLAWICENIFFEYFYFKSTIGAQKIKRIIWNNKQKREFVNQNERKKKLVVCKQFKNNASINRKIFFVTEYTKIWISIYKKVKTANIFY